MEYLNPLLSALLPLPLPLPPVSLGTVKSMLTDFSLIYLEGAGKGTFIPDRSILSLNYYGKYASLFDTIPVFFKCLRCWFVS